MKQFLSFLLLLTLTLSGTTSYSQAKKKKAPVAKKVETVVYICGGSSAYAYHTSSSCRGLNRCTHGVSKVTQTEAVKTHGRKACKICG